MIDHALFPATEDEPDPPDVERIHVTRFEKGGQVWCPRVFSAEELSGLDSIYELFGGGSYEVIGRSSKNKDGRNLISGRRRYQIPGPPKALVDDGGEGVQPSAPAFAPAAPAQGLGNSIWPVVLGLIPPVLQAWLGSQKEHTAMIMAMMNQQQQTTMMMMQGQKADSQAFVQAMAKMNESEKATMAQFFGKLADSKSGGGGGDIEALMAGLELGTTMGQKQQSDDGGDLGQLAQLAAALAQLNASNPPATPSQPSAPPQKPPVQG